MAIHSLLEGVHIKFDVFGKAEELGILSQVSAVYDKILEILNSTYHITEEEALELIDEKSDAVYTRKLEAIFTFNTAQCKKLLLCTLYS